MADGEVLIWNSVSVLFPSSVRKAWLAGYQYHVLFWMLSFVSVQLKLTRYTLLINDCLAQCCIPVFYCLSASIFTDGMLIL